MELMQQDGMALMDGARKAELVRLRAAALEWIGWPLARWLEM